MAEEVTLIVIFHRYVPAVSRWIVTSSLADGPAPDTLADSLLLKQGVRDLLRFSDTRMSGASLASASLM